MGDLKSSDCLNLSNNLMFFEVMKDKTICRLFLEKLLGFTITKLEFLVPEYSMLPYIGQKGIRLDVYAEDDKGNVYDIEMQNQRLSKEYPLEMRSRYYRSVIDVEHLKAGMKYSRLPASYIIFICDYDEFGLNRKRYILLRHSAAKIRI